MAHRQIKLDDSNVKGYHDLIVPDDLRRDILLSEKAARTVHEGRRTLVNCMAGKDKRIILAIGPCSIHDPEADEEYSEKLLALSRKVGDVFVMVKRAYFEKPRTTVGWKGLIYEPLLHGEENINLGLRLARHILVKNAEMGLLTSTEFVDTFVPQYIGDTVSMAAIGARTVESPLHRQMASALSMPALFKNSTRGDIEVAVEALVAAASEHWFTGLDPTNSKGAIVTSRGNKNAYIVLRGGKETGPNYHSENVRKAQELLLENGFVANLGVDCSHDNTIVGWADNGKATKDYKMQSTVFLDLIGQIANGNTGIKLIMLESNLKEGAQKIPKAHSKEPIKWGVSVTDACIGWEQTEELVLWAHGALRK
ncbi:MAG: 3-deoxy-7-phosphoheptulonate synthase [Candidatus Micrarchaeota archaeon]|nr:3-deoxy-7-phosphoheptulonate synthase [Candidatus Micrarchaeota archaeon]MDE1834003.1 3-deoxy-7-phosphoheptulonate synthase [Candidatus Micrarchaeota archaeon]MDE1859509.1 3-deoxy-7-phosphoheptulonate synthase [Candidatus Micrarchaeota archaeon]